VTSGIDVRGSCQGVRCVGGGGGASVPAGADLVGDLLVGDLNVCPASGARFSPIERLCGL
jgi:hypothetical protein